MESSCPVTVKIEIGHYDIIYRSAKRWCTLTRESSCPVMVKSDIDWHWPSLYFIYVCTCHTLFDWTVLLYKDLLLKQISFYHNKRNLGDFVIFKFFFNLRPRDKRYIEFKHSHWLLLQWIHFQLKFLQYKKIVWFQHKLLTFEVSFDIYP